MQLKVGNSIPVSTNFIKSHPAIPVYNGDDSIENLFAVIYHIEIGYNKDGRQEVLQYVIVDYKEYSLAPDNKGAIIDIANQYCRDKGIEDKCFFCDLVFFIYFRRSVFRYSQPILSLLDQ